MDMSDKKSGEVFITYTYQFFQYSKLLTYFIPVKLYKDILKGFYFILKAVFYQIIHI